MMPLDPVKEIHATACGLRRKAMLDQLLDDLLDVEAEDRAALVLDLFVALINDVEDRMGVEVGGKYIAIGDFQYPGAMGQLHSYFDRRIILDGTDHGRDPGPGLQLAGHQVNAISDLHAV